MRRAIKRASLKRCGFHLRVCSMGVSVLANIKNPFPSIPFSVWNLFYSHLHTKNSKESLKRKRTRNIIWIFSGNLIADGRRGVRPVLGRGIWEKGVLRNQSVYLRVCVHLKGRSCYNIGLYCRESWSPTVARYLTALHLQQSKQKPTRGTQDWPDTARSQTPLDIMV